MIGLGGGEYGQPRRKEVWNGVQSSVISRGARKPVRWCYFECKAVNGGGPPWSRASTTRRRRRRRSKVVLWDVGLHAGSATCPILQMPYGICSIDRGFISISPWSDSNFSPTLVNPFSATSSHPPPQPPHPPQLPTSSFPHPHPACSHHSHPPYPHRQPR